MIDKEKITNELETRLEDVASDEWTKKLLNELNNGKSSPHFNHIRNNLICNISCCLRGNLKKATYYFRIHDTYVRLLKEFPDFCDGEFNPDNHGGHFPDIKDYNMRNRASPSAHYVVFSERRLRKKK
jgi:hypothetical protein